MMGSSEPGDVTTLIPYLFYASDSSCLLYLFDHRPPAHLSPDELAKVQQEDFEKTKRGFPAFAVILATPGAASVLATYSRDSKRRMALRLAALVTLRYLDAQACADIAAGPAFRTDSFRGDSTAEGCFNTIKAGRGSFRGVISNLISEFPTNPGT
jgi:hypothetical protein